MQTSKHLHMLRTQINAFRAMGESIALVPTMGALHAGHLSLVRAAKRAADRVVVSIFVNPTQFAPGEDLDQYPRQMEEDAGLLVQEGVDVLWAPEVEEMYPAGFSTSIHVSGVSKGFCGSARPGHFDGVASVVCKLFNQVTPDMAFFGEKDWQQLAVIRAMARDLDLSFPKVGEIYAVPTMREEDGLAMSSRNRYLSEEERRAAAALPRAMAEAKSAIEGDGNVASAVEELRAKLLAAGFTSVDYAGLADTLTMAELAALHGRPARLLVAARIGKTRLIDNIGIG